MSRIHRLPPELANQIAAGEVVERPASVIKELVENAIDAGAHRLAIEVEFGGKKLIAVEDDGEGMTAEEAALAIERHATSKIRTAADLAAIQTLGFRGEALPSIASVSHFRLRTRPRGALAGTELRVEAGRLISTREVGAPEGTLVAVADLFFNLPARRKFLKADTAESAQASRIVTQLALGYPKVGFVLKSAGRLLIEAPPAGSTAERFFQLYGDRPDLVPVAKEAAGVSVHGFVAGLGEQGPARGPQHIFVNRRIVRDRTIAHAIQQAYSIATIKERSPEVHLFIELAPERVDVNVHPTKAEVRFLDQGLVHEVLRRAIVDALGGSNAPELVLRAAAAFHPGGLPAAVLPLGFGSMASAPGAGLGATSGAGLAGYGAGQAATAAATLAPPSWADPAAAATTTAGRETVTTLIRPMTPLGQFRNTFIIAVDDEGLAIIDQHVAHERILFEKVLADRAAGRVESQRLLMPLILQLTPAQQIEYARISAELHQAGFETEPFGNRTLAVKAAPAAIAPQDLEKVLFEVLEIAEDELRGISMDDVRRHLAASIACRAAIKVNMRLEEKKMDWLLRALASTSCPMSCPHGRPIALHYPMREILKAFHRI